MQTSGRWSREELLVALNLYCQIPFGRMDARNPEVVSLARQIGRTPSAVAMKLVNFASLDPAITSTGRRGLGNASAADRALWEEMQSNWNQFAEEAREAAAIMEVPVTEIADEDAADDFTGPERQAQTTVRVGQGFFRRAVLSAYDHRCCISGLTVTPLLIASHIVPWRVDPANRLNPRNGLCLSAIHDRAFDAGIITIDEDLTVRVSERHRELRGEFFEAVIGRYHLHPITIPEKFAPEAAFLAYHRENVFLG